ncbi:GNAT family N-acetyltransferase [Lusitaniella coriacea LEGE 07157]|uniref:GNAT family N-acetyltransferase n=1 Tax=Lusitaniella coriacea LEGE 07157 TaxID=945747 RepID=A0A8J7B7R3_9CYAN|nr:GNAT family N-acetyltransferase [Lusitaniella coriacea]MBE9115471.1 GNAT family N-acetyltransferase [Lusitaniella coriacea LEGE 07157]
MLQTPRLILRGWQPSDREPFARLNADPEVMKYFPATLSRQESDELIERIESHRQTHNFCFWAVEERSTGAFIGFIGLKVPAFEAHFTPTVEVGWRLAKEFWGKGYATEGAKEAIRYGFETIGLNEIVSFTAQINLRSIAVMKRLGMTHNQADDFNHPSLPSGHPLQRHVFFRIQSHA